MKLVVDVDPAGGEAAVGEGDGGEDAAEEAGGGVVGVEAFVGVKLREDGWVFGELEEDAGNGRGGVVELDSGVSAEVVEMGVDGACADDGALVHCCGNFSGRVAGAECAVDEEGGHRLR